MRDNMTPEEKEQFEELQKKVKQLEQVEGNEFIGNLQERNYKRVIDFDVSKTEPDFFVELIYKGRVYKLWATENE